MPQPKPSKGKSVEGEGLRLDLLLGYDPTRAPRSRSAKVTPNDRHRRPDPKKTSSHEKPASHSDDRKNAARPKPLPQESQRNHSPWTPETSVSSNEDLVPSDDLRDDIFFHAYNDPRLRQLSESWRKRIVDGRLYHRVGRTGTLPHPRLDGDHTSTEVRAVNLYQQTERR